MDLQKLRKLTNNYKGGLKRLAFEINMTEANLHRCINRNKIQAQDLENISKQLGVSIIEFFDEESKTNIGAGDIADKGIINKPFMSNSNGNQNYSNGDLIKIEVSETLREEEKTICSLVSEIEHLNSLLNERERIITEKQERITELKERIEELKAR